MENHVISLQQEILKDKQWNEGHIIILIKKKRERERTPQKICMYEKTANEMYLECFIPIFSLNYYKKKF